MVGPTKPTTVEKGYWEKMLPSGKAGSKGKVVNPFRKAVTAAVRTGLAAVGRPSPNHSAGAQRHALEIANEVFKRNRPTADDNEISDAKRFKPKKYPKGT